MDTDNRFPRSTYCIQCGLAFPTAEEVIDVICPDCRETNKAKKQRMQRVMKWVVTTFIVTMCGAAAFLATALIPAIPGVHVESDILIALFLLLFGGLLFLLVRYWEHVLPIGTFVFVFVALPIASLALVVYVFNVYGLLMSAMLAVLLWRIL